MIQCFNHPNVHIHNFLKHWSFIWGCYFCLSILKCEFRSFEKTNGKEVITYYEIQLKKAATKKLLGITIDEYLNFNKHITNIPQTLSRKFSAMSRCPEYLLCLAFNRKMLYQTLSSVDNSIIVLFYGYLVLSGLTAKSKNYMTGLNDYVTMTNFWRTFDQTRPRNYS